MPYKLGKCLLSYHLQRKRMSQQELAIKVKKTRQTISRYVNNQNVMSFETAANIASALNLQMEDLYELVEIDE